MKWHLKEAKETIGIADVPYTLFDITNVYEWAKGIDNQDNAFRSVSIPPWKYTWCELKVHDGQLLIAITFNKVNGEWIRTLDIAGIDVRSTMIHLGRAHVPMINGISSQELQSYALSKYALTVYSHDELHNMIRIALIVTNYAFMFCHIKNVTIEDIVPPVKVQKKRKKNNKFKGHTYKRLSIKLMGKYGRGETHTLQKNRFHIFRGHFKDYTKGNGLFGKYKGVYFWEMGTRGNKKLGTVTNSYDIDTV